MTAETLVNPQVPERDYRKTFFGSYKDFAVADTHARHLQKQGLRVRVAKGASGKYCVEQV